jgi:D-lactate dehydrogenase
MKTLFYSVKQFERPYLDIANVNQYDIERTSQSLTLRTAELAAGFPAICIFPGDDASTHVLEKLYQQGVRFIAIRAAGYDNVDLKKAEELGISVANVPDYSPYAIAEHAAALILALNRKVALANRQVHDHDFRVDKLLGFDLHGKTIGIIGTGRIGGVFARIMHGFGCRLLGFDIEHNNDLTRQYGLKYVDMPALCRDADIIAIHTPLNPSTKYIINKETIGLMKTGVMLINTSRGGCVNTKELLDGLKSGHIGYYGADVYEKERGIFFYNWLGRDHVDDVLDHLLRMPNVLITPHQAFATDDALQNIAETTFYNLGCWTMGIQPKNELTIAMTVL